MASVLFAEGDVERAGHDPAGDRYGAGVDLYDQVGRQDEEAVGPGGVERFTGAILQRRDQPIRYPPIEKVPIPGMA